MRNSEPHNLIAWLGISFRWLILIGLCVSLILQGVLHSYLAYIVLGVGLWNLVLTGAVLFQRRIPSQRKWSLFIDFIAANGVFYLSGTLSGPVGWVALLPVIPAALNFEKTRQVIGVSLVTVLSLSVLASISAPVLDVFLFTVSVLVLSLFAGVFAHSLCVKIARLMQDEQRERAKARQENAKLEKERRRIIYNVISALSDTLNYQRVLETALEQSTTALAKTDADNNRLVGAVLLFAKLESGGTRLKVGAARRLTPSDLRMTLAGKAGLLGQTIEQGSPQAVKNVASDPELKLLVAVRACKAAYCLPLRSGLDTYGVLLVAHPEEEYFNQDRREILDIIGNQAAIALHNARLYEELELEKERAVETQEEARKKLARDLHDGPTQSISALAMRINYARRLLERDVEAAADELFKIEDLARRTTSEIRHMLFTLRPLVLESQGMVPALESVVQKMRENYSQDVFLEIDPKVVAQLESGKQGVIFYIAEEAVNNARKHASPEHIWVRLKLVRDDLALLEIEDDGSGFDIQQIDLTYASRGSLGMVNMRERAELIDGVFSLESVQGKGTRVRVVIPLTEQAIETLQRQL